MSDMKYAITLVTNAAVLKMSANMPMRRRCRDFTGPAVGNVALRFKSNRNVNNQDWQRLIKENTKTDTVKEVQMKSIQHLRAVWEEDMIQRMIEAETWRRFNDAKLAEHDIEKRREQIKERRAEEKRLLDTIKKTPDQERAERLEILKQRSKDQEAARREADKKLAMQKYEQQFREGCDELRSEISKRNALEVASDRYVQIAMQREQRRLEKEQEDEIDRFIAQYQAQNHAPSEEFVKRKKQQHFSSELRMQVIEKEKQSAHLKEMKAQERMKIEALRRQLEEDKLNAITTRHEKIRQVRQGLQQTVTYKAETQAEEDRKEQMFNQAILRQANVDSEIAKVNRSALRQRANLEAKEYLHFVQANREAEKKHEKEIEAIVCEATQEEMQKVTDQRQRRQQACRQLAHEAVQTCLQQITAKDEERAANRQRRPLEACQQLHDLERAKKADDQDTAVRRCQLEAYRADLEAQITYRQQELQQAAEESKREDKRMVDFDTELRDRIRRLLLADSTSGDANRHPWRQYRDDRSMKSTVGPMCTGALETCQ